MICAVQPITPFALSAYLDSLKAEGYTILLVRCSATAARVCLQELSPCCKKQFSW